MQIIILRGYDFYSPISKSKIASANTFHFRSYYAGMNLIMNVLVSLLRYHTTQVWSINFYCFCTYFTGMHKCLLFWKHAARVCNQNNLNTDSTNFLLVLILSTQDICTFALNKHTTRVWLLNTILSYETKIYICPGYIHVNF